MTSWLRRLSRDRGSKYAEGDDMYPFRPQSSHHPDVTSRQSQQQQQQQQQLIATRDSEFPPTPNSIDMMRQNNIRGSSEPPHNWSAPPLGNLPAGNNSKASDPASAPFESLPDSLTRAFNETLRPYQERISSLQAELDAAHQQNERLEAERAELHNWIDRRGLRPDLPPELSGTVANDPVAASTLATQLERKMTMLNYSLHHLADSLPSAPPTLTVTSALSALLPTIGYLSTLPAGPPFAFESLIKLAGNLNSHSTGDETSEDRKSIASFYDDLDQVMDRVVGKRVVAVAEGEEKWDIGRDVKRLEKTGAFLRKEMGVNNYFVKSLEVMRGEGRGPAGAGGERMTRYSSDSH